MIGKMEQQKKHFKQLVGSPTHAGAWILPGGRDIEYIVIDRVEERKGENVNGSKKDVTVAVFKPNPYTTMDMILNVTNAAELCKQAKVNSWCLLDIKNQPVRLTYAETPKGDGLRISKLPAKLPTAPQPKPKPELTADKFDAAVAFLQKPGSTIEKLRESYSISAEMEKKLMEKCDGLKKGKEEK
jgi:hypothetical protein